MTALPEPPAATAAGQAHNSLTDAVIRAAVDSAIAEARRHDTSPRVVIGNTPAVPQPGIPPMSSKAVDDAVRMLAAGAASLPIGGMTALVVHVLGTVDPTQLAIAGATPVALILALRALIGRAKGVLPEEHHHHYEGPVYQDQRTQHSSTRGLVARTNNQQ